MSCKRQPTRLEQTPKQLPRQIPIRIRFAIAPKPLDKDATISTQVSLRHFFVITSLVAIALPFLIYLSRSDQPASLSYFVIFTVSIVVHLGFSSVRMRPAFRWFAVVVGPTLLVSGLCGAPGSWLGSRLGDLAILLALATTGMLLSASLQKFSAPRMVRYE